MEIKEIEKIICGFMGYCSVRYPTDGELAMSKEDIKQYKATAQAIHEAQQKEMEKLELEITAHGYALSVLRSHFGLPEGESYKEITEVAIKRSALKE